MRTPTLPSRCAAAAVAALATFALVLPAQSQPGENLHVSELSQHTHIHGLAVDRQDPPSLLIATHHGLFRAGPDGQAERISVVQDFMGFQPHPSEPDILFASGHPPEGGNLGFIASRDGGRTWRQISPGVNGPVDFHQMTVSPADPRRIYGAYRELQVSRDGGRTWEIVGPRPEGLIDLAASAESPDTLYAATETGLLVSSDAGQSWEDLMGNSPVSMIEVAPDGGLYAFVVGRGLVSAREGSGEFETVSSDWGSHIPLHLAIDPADPDRLYAATQFGRILLSTNGGRDWAALGS